MKRNIIKVCILSLILIIISVTVISIMGKTYTVVFNYGIDESNTITTEGSTGEAEIIDEKITDGKHILKVKAVKPGKMYYYINHESFSESVMLYIHKNNVITENSYFGKSTCSEIIPISLSIILLYILILLYKEYRKSMKENMYQYKNIAYVGIIVFLSFFTISNVATIFNYQGLFETINRTISSISFVSFFLFPISLVTFTLVTISNINLIRKEGKSLRNLLGLFLGLFIIVLSLLPDYIYGLLMQSQIINIYNLNGPGPYIYNLLEAIVYLTIAYLECVLIGTVVVAIKSVKKKLEYNKDYVIILGCQIKKDGSLPPLLKGRVDKALEFRNKQLEETKKDLIFITSGGQGSDEPISEAEAMKNYLVDNGIKEKNILLDDKSTSTYENLKYSYNLVKDKNANVIYSTTNYHVLRAGLIATEQGLKLEGIGSKTKSYFWINAFIREFIGTLYSEKKKHILFFLLMVIVLIVMILITYICNNI